MFINEHEVNGGNYQILKLSGSFQHYTNNKIDIEVIGVYRSSRRNLQDHSFISELVRLIDRNKICIIMGDFNISLANQAANLVPQRLQEMGFMQKIDKPTHIRGGVIDHFYLFCPANQQNVIVNWDLFAPFYSDHFGISIVIN